MELFSRKPCRKNTSNTGSSNFRKLSVYPSQAEILGDRIPFRKNIIREKFPNVEQYLDIHFRLLREDFVSALREGIEKHRAGEETTNIDVYRHVKILKNKNEDSVKMFKIELLNLQEPLDLEESKKLMVGSLLIFTEDNFETIYLAKVIRREEEDLQNNKLDIKFIDKNVKISQNHVYTMAECCTFFEPYFQVLKVLQHMSFTNFPMEKYIVQVQTSDQQFPKYLLRSETKYEIDGYSFFPKEWPVMRKNLYNLNNMQYEAFRAALTEEFVVIQGPPGTGKTFLGLKIAETLIKNYRVWYNSSPILVISHKNHALDQFLEGLIPITDRIVRVGGQSKSEKLQEYNLEYLKLTDSVNGLVLNQKTSRAKNSAKNDLAILSKALVVAMTTTAAARMKETLEELRCPIVIVEEAAEVLESHVVAALTTRCEHLILLGDHKQLQPITADHVIGTKYGLGMSLFERMVLNGIHCYTLNVQHRMRPEISDLLRATVYPFLQDHVSCHQRPNISGLDKNVFFIDHRQPEEVSNLTSRKNTYEAEFLVAFARHLVLNGHKSEDIVILATYSGQVEELEERKRVWNKRQILENVRISTLDGFQGQESEIVLLSLVRSEMIGFLSTENRICVALSRPRNGLFVIGNMRLLKKKSEMWKTVKNCLKKQEAIGKYLLIRCQKHPEMVTKAKCAEDFLNLYGGCNMKCKSKLKCGHLCTYSCHVIDEDHQNYFECRKLCGRKICSIHKDKICTKKCSSVDCDKCNLCISKLKKTSKKASKRL